MKILNFKFKNRKQNGFSIILAVVFIGAVSLTIVLSFLTLGRASISGSLVFSKSAQADSLADACAEIALQEIRNSTPFSGTGSTSIEEGDCNYEVISDGGQDRTINSEGLIDDIVSRVTVIVDQINPEINIVSWEKVGNF